MPGRASTRGRPDRGPGRHRPAAPAHPPGDHIHGIVTHGGERPTSSPESTRGTWMIRSRTMAELAELGRGSRVLRAGTLATGCQVEMTPTGPPYSEGGATTSLAARYRANAEAIGRRFDAAESRTPRPRGRRTWPTSASPSRPSTRSGLDACASNHQPEFAAACVTASADDAIREARRRWRGPASTSRPTPASASGSSAGDHRAHVARRDRRA